MTLEAQRLYDTGQGGDELATATYPVVKADQARKARKSERIAKQNRLDAVASRIAQRAAATR